MALPGVARVEYDAARDLFMMDYDDTRLDLKLIFTQIHQAGRSMGREYEPEIVTPGP
jgi:hypothetical protein